MEDSRLQDSERIRWIICALLLRLAVYALSSDLVRGIAHGPETLFTSVNVGYAEDLQMGTWVKNQAEKKDHTKEVKYVEDKSLIIDLEGAETEKDKKTGANIASRE